MKKVCIITSGHPPYDDRVFYKEARSLRRAGWKVTLICSTGNYDELTEGITVFGFRMDPFLTRIFIGRIFKLIRLVRLAIKERYDVYHCHEFGPLAVAHIANLIWSISREGRKRIIYDVHEWFPWSISWESGNPLLKRIRAWFYHRIHSLLCNRTDHIIVTEELKIGLFQSTLAHSRITAIKNFPPLELFRPSKKNSHSGRFVIGYAGGLSRERGIYDLARATQLFSEKSGLRPELLLIGDFYSAWRRKTFTDSFGAAAFDLHITGWIPHPEVPIFLRDADVCAIPLPQTARFLRSLPVKLYEYMALSKPVIASNFGEMRRVIQQTHCGILVDPSNPERMADVITYYHNNPDLIRQHGNNGRHWVEKEYNWARSERVLLSIYSNLQPNSNVVSQD